ncbi:MAG: branched-chain amino acid ABC transporter permease [Acidimicrobiia bacterium]
MFRKLTGAAIVTIAGLALLLGWSGGAARAQATPDEGTVRVTVQDQDAQSNKTPLPGISITVTEADGSPVEGCACTAVTGEDGRVEFIVPERKPYLVTLDESTLPEGKGLQPDATGEAGASRPVTIGTTGVGNKLFFTGESSTRSESWIAKVPQRLLDGLRLGLIIAITSVGLSLIFGTTGLTNFAHGELVTFGGMMAFLLNVSWGIPLLLAGPVAVALGGVFGYFLDWGLWARLRRRGIGLVSQLVVSVGLSILLKNLFLLRFGGRTRPLADYADQVRMNWWKFGITPRDLITSLISLAVLIAVALTLQRSRMGKATRAVADNVDLASATGIDSQKVIRLVWVIGAALAAFGGIVRGLDEQVSSEMGSNLLFLMFAGITLGGLGSAFGALVGGLIVGVFTELLTLAVPTELKNVPPLVVLILVLLVRPQGILGSKQRVG